MRDLHLYTVISKCLSEIIIQAEKQICMKALRQEGDRWSLGRYKKAGVWLKHYQKDKKKTNWPENYTEEFGFYSKCNR